MYALKNQDQGINTLSQTDYLPILIDSFLTDRKSQGFAAQTVEFYRKKLNYFSEFCEVVPNLTGKIIKSILIIPPQVHSRIVRSASS